MTTALASAPVAWTTVGSLFPLEPRPAMTLNDLILTACDELAAQRAVACPVCNGSMAPRASAVGVSGGRCGDCRATLG